MIALVLRRHLANPAIVSFALAGSIMVVLLPNEIVPVQLLFLTMIASLVVPQRADAFELSLPIRGRDLVLGRALSALAFALLPVATWVVVAAARDDRGVVGLQVASALLAALLVLAPYVLARGAPRSGIDWSRIGAWAVLAPASTVWLIAPTLATVAGAVGVAASFVAL